MHSLHLANETVSKMSDALVQLSCETRGVKEIYMLYVGISIGKQNLQPSLMSSEHEIITFFLVAFLVVNVRNSSCKRIVIS